MEPLMQLRKRSNCSMPVGLSHVSRQRQRQDHQLPAHQGGGLGHRTVGCAMIEAPCAARGVPAAARASVSWPAWIVNTTNCS